MLKKKSFLVGLSLTFLTFITGHFFMVNIYVFPDEWRNDDLERVARRYMEPQFFQGWGVFAPVPREESFLFYRYYSAGRWSQEISLDEEMKAFSHHAALRIGQMNAFFLGKETREYAIKTETEMDYSLVKSTYYYDRVMYTVYTHLMKKTPSIELDSIELILERKLLPKRGFTEKKTIRDYYGADACE